MKWMMLGGVPYFLLKLGQAGIELPVLGLPTLAVLGFKDVILGVVDDLRGRTDLCPGAGGQHATASNNQTPETSLHT